MATETVETRRAVRLFTMREVAEQLGISIRSAWALVAGGRIRVLKVSPRATRVLEADLLAFVQNARSGRARA